MSGAREKYKCHDIKRGIIQRRDHEPDVESTICEEQDPISGGYASEGEAEVREILNNVEVQRQQVVSAEEFVDEQIAEVLSSEAEVLKEHNIMGSVKI